MGESEALPPAWPILGQKKALLRRGGITTIAGPSGSMKTFFALNMAMRIGVPTMYFSSDSDEATVAARLLSYHTGEQSEETEKWLTEQKDFAHDVLKSCDHIKWCFDPAPSIDDLYLEADAFAAVRGAYAALTTVDILMDINDGSGAVTQNYWTTMRDLKIFARDTRTALLVVHHTSSSVPGDPVQPRSAFMGKADHLPTLMFNLAGDSTAGRLHVSIVKNRYGPSDDTGKNYFSLNADPAISRISEIVYT